MQMTDSTIQQNLCYLLKNRIFGPKTAKFGPKLAFWAKYRHFWPTWSNAWPKNNADKLPKWFSVMLVPKLLLNPIKIRLFGPKTAKFGPKSAFLVILGQILPFFAHFVQCPTIGDCGVRAVSRKTPIYFIHIVFWSGIGQKVQKMAIFGPKWPKMQILDQIWPFLGQKS